MIAPLHLHSSEIGFCLAKWFKICRHISNLRTLAKDQFCLDYFMVDFFWNYCSGIGPQIPKPIMDTIRIFFLRIISWYNNQKHRKYQKVMTEYYYLVMYLFFKMLCQKTWNIFLIVFKTLGNFIKKCIWQKKSFF